jgi:hypothetical protein
MSAVLLGGLAYLAPLLVLLGPLLARRYPGAAALAGRPPVRRRPRAARAVAPDGRTVIPAPRGPALLALSRAGRPPPRPAPA